MFIIYQVTNKVNGKRYIGKTSRTVSVRWKDHVESSVGGSQYYFHKAIRKHGTNSFEIKELETVSDEDVANYREIFWIAALQTYRPDRGYNQTFGGEGRVFTQSLEARAKISAAGRGKIITEEQKQKISASLTGRPGPFRGKKLSASHIESLRKKVFTKEHRDRLSAAAKADWEKRKQNLPV